MSNVDFRNLLIQRFARQFHPTLLLEQNSQILVFDQITIAFRLGPAAAGHRCARGRIFTPAQCLCVQRVDISDAIVNFHLLLTFAHVVI